MTRWLSTMWKGKKLTVNVELDEPLVVALLSLVAWLEHDGVRTYKRKTKVSQAAIINTALRKLPEMQQALRQTEQKDQHARDNSPNEAA